MKVALKLCACLTIATFVSCLEIAILGVTGKTGKDFLPLALKAGHKVRAMVRDIDRAKSMFSDLDDELKKNIKYIKGDIESKEEVFDELVNGADIVLGALGAYRNSKKEVPVEKGTRKVVPSMKKYGVRKYIVISTEGIISKFMSTPLMSVFMWFVLNHISNDHIADEKFLSENSADIDWITLHPPYIVPYASSIGYKIGIEERVEGSTGEIPYVDLAQALLHITTNSEQYIHKKLHVTSTIPFVKKEGIDYYPDLPRLFYDAIRDKILLNPIAIFIIIYIIRLFLPKNIRKRKEQEKAKSS